MADLELCHALKGCLVADDHTISLQTVGVPTIIISPKKLQWQHDQHLTLRIVVIIFEPDCLKIEVRRPTGVRTLIVLNYEDPRFISQLRHALSKVGILFDHEMLV